MKVLGLITEYNPFHNGHKYHLEKSISLTEATHVVAVMSGNFLQRGDTALVDKWSRAEMAVKEGVDLVLELPVLYACSTAELFAFGGISLLNQLNLVNDLCFGSECGDINILNKIAEVLVKEPIEYKNILKEGLSKGYSFPTARSIALEKYMADENISGVTESSNNILGIEYLKALIKTNSNIKPSTIQRFGAQYNSTNIEGSICSATAIRVFLSDSTNSIKDLKKVIPSESFSTLAKLIEQGKGPVFIENLEQSILLTLRKASRELLKSIIDVNEGLENRIKSAALESKNIEEFYSLVGTKRYTLTRLKRITIHALLGITEDHYKYFNNRYGCQYARVLAFSNKGLEILRKLKETSKIPIITNISKQSSINKAAEKMLRMDVLASDLYALGYSNQKYRTGSSDYYARPFIVKG